MNHPVSSRDDQHALLHESAAVDNAATRSRFAGLTMILRLATHLAYPIAILCVWRWLSPRYVGVVLLALLWIQRTMGSGVVASSLRRLSWIDWTVAGGLSCASIAIVLTDSEMLLRLYPALVNLGLLVAFAATLIRGPSMIERFARLSRPNPEPHIVRYTRTVTRIWCSFFAANAAFSAYTANHWSHNAWSIYNGLVAYLLSGALLAGEYLWRTCVLEPRDARRSAM